MDLLGVKTTLVRSLILSTILLNVVASIGDDELTDIRKACETNLDFKSIGEFREFIKRLHELFDSHVDHKLQVESSPALRKCYQDKDALFELDELIADYNSVRPCKYKEIGKLETYAKRHLSAKKRPISLKFFTLFGLNVGYHCSKNLMAHIKQADEEADQIDFIYSMASPTGWNVLINEHTKKTMKFGASTNVGNEIPNRIAKLVPGLLTVTDLNYMDFNNLRSLVPNGDDWNGIETESYSFEEESLAQEMKSSLAKTIESCQSLDQFYVNNILSLARLNSLGLLLSFNQFTNHHERSPMIHKWLVAASFCQLMARVSIEGSEEESASMMVEILHDDERIESRRTLYSYVAEFKEIHPEAVDKRWLASVPEGSWLKPEQAMFVPGGDDRARSMAMRQLMQFIRGVERDLRSRTSRGQ